MGRNVKVNARKKKKAAAFLNRQHSFSGDTTLFEASSNILKKVSHAQVMSLFP